MLNIQKKRRSWALYFAGFLLFIQLFSLVSPVAQVHATTIDPGAGTTPIDNSPYGQASVTERAAVWVVARAAAQCLNSASIFPPGKISEDDANSGKWFVGGDKHVGEYTGLVIEGTSSDDDKSSCDSVIKKMLNSTGISAATYLCAMGLTRDAAASGCETGIGSFKLPSSITSGSQLEKAWSRVFLDKWAGGKSYSSMLTSGMVYYIYFNDFRQACGQGDGGASDRTLGWSVSPWSDQVTTKELASNKKDYHIPWVSGGLLQDSYVVSTNYDEGQDVGIDGWNTNGTNYLDKDLKNNSNNSVNDSLKCRSLASNMNVLADAATAEFAADAAAGKQQSGAGALSSGAASDRAGSCEANNGGLAWFGCAILEVFDGIIGFLDSQIRSLLTVQTTALDQAGGLKKAWGIMRNFAYLILVPLMLLMVIGTAVGFGPFDAYTVKKALPRMVSAVIFMSISYYLCLFLINISNDVGKGIFNLITLAAPGGAVNSLTDIFGGGAGGLFATLGAGGLVIAGFAGSVTWGVFFSFALVTVVALLIGYVILVIRQVLIIMLLVLSPLAILVWIFPGNDKLWNVWKTTFTAMLMMFPLIMVLIAAGRFFAATVDTTFGGPTGTFIKLIAYIAPYFFIPATFKYGLGVFGNLAGMINDRSRGIFDRQRKFREGSRLNARQKAMENRRFAGGTGNNLRGRLNRGIGGTMNAPGAILSEGATFKPSQWKSALRSNTTTTAISEEERALKENASYLATNGNDGLWKQARTSTGAADLRSKLQASGMYKPGEENQMEEDIAHVERVRRSVSEKTFRSLAAQAAFSGGTAHDKPAEALQWAAEAAGDDAVMRARLTTALKTASSRNGRFDTNAAWGTLNGGISEIWKDMKANNGRVSSAVLESVNDKVLDSAEEANATSQILSGKGTSAKNIAEHKAQKIQKTIAGIQAGTATQEDLTVQLADVAVMEGSLGYGPQGNAEVIRKSLLNATVVDAANPSQTISIHDLAHDDTTTSQTAYQQRVRTGLEQTRADIEAMRVEAQRRGVPIEQVAQDRATASAQEDIEQGRRMSYGDRGASGLSPTEAAYLEELNRPKE